MDACAKTLLDGANGPLNLPDVAVGGDHVKMGRMDGIMEAGKFMVSMDVSDLETTTCVEFDNGQDAPQHGGILAIRDRADGTKLQITGDGV